MSGGNAGFNGHSARTGAMIMRGRSIHAALVFALIGGCAGSHVPDAGMDAGAMDAGTRDSGLSTDSGTTDACPTPHELAPGVLGGECCPSPYMTSAVFGEDAGVLLCPPPDYSGSGGYCTTLLNWCADGLVCVAGGYPSLVTGRCLEMPYCEYVTEVNGVSPADGWCYYGDLTTPVTGTRPEVSCTDGDVASGLCGNGCPCASTAQLCVGSSEVHPVGLCSPVYCDPLHPGSRACSADELCLFVDPEHWPDFWIERAVDWRGILEPPGGYCVTQAQCDAIEALYPGFWRCLARGEVAEYNPAAIADGGIDAI